MHLIITNRVLITTESIIDVITCFCLLKFLFYHYSTSNTTSFNGSCPENSPDPSDNNDEESETDSYLSEDDESSGYYYYDKNTGGGGIGKGSSNFTNHHRKMRGRTKCAPGGRHHTFSDKKLSFTKRLLITLYTVLCPCMWLYWPLRYLRHLLNSYKLKKTKSSQTKLKPKKSFFSFSPTSSEAVSNNVCGLCVCDPQQYPPKQKSSSKQKILI